MRVVILIVAIGLSLATCGRTQFHAVSTSMNLATNAREANATTGTGRIDFASQIKPILEAKCEKCHFAGGPMYERLPFDRPETIVKLGTKLFTRLKDENDQRVIREFLAQQSEPAQANP